LATILEYIKLHGEQLDSDLAEALGLPLKQVRAHIQDLHAKGDIMTCFVTRYRNGRKFEGWACRAAGFIPSAAPGRRPSQK
jgi:predicted ArsR family transcriptional regulator